MANAEERHKIDSEVVRILRKLGLKSETLEFLQNLNTPDQKQTQDHRDRRGRAWSVASLGLSTLAWYYAVITPEPNFFYTSTLLAGTILFGSLTLLELFTLGLRGKISLGLAALLVFGIADFASYQGRRQRIADKLVLERAAARKDTYRLLSGSMELTEGDDPIRSVFAYVNGGDTPIVVTNICGLTKSLNLANYNFMPHSSFCMFPEGEQHRIRDGGDGQVDLLLSRTLNLGITQIACADITVTIVYSLETQPETKEGKQFRFVSRWSPRGMRWLKEDVESRNDFCYDKQFQAPYGNMIAQPPSPK
jgi:hypothetical protein